MVSRSTQPLWLSSLLMACNGSFCLFTWNQLRSVITTGMRSRCICSSYQNFHLSLHFCTVRVYGFIYFLLWCVKWSISCENSHLNNAFVVVLACYVIPQKINLLCACTIFGDRMSHYSTETMSYCSWFMHM